jgi:hypothetical protein
MVTFIMANKLIDFAGAKIGRLTVLHRDMNPPNKRCAYWICQCSCGTIIRVTGSDLKRHPKSVERSCGCASRLPARQAYLNRLYRGYKYSAYNRSLEFKLTKDDVFEMFSQNCIYCNSAPSYPNKVKLNRYYNGIEKTNGIDRIDSSIGYTKDNCVPCCSMCNQLKFDYVLEIWLEHIKKIYQHSIIEGKLP